MKLNPAEEWKLYETMWDSPKKTQLHELKRYIPPVKLSPTTKVDYRDCKKAFENLSLEIKRTLPSTKYFSRKRISESLIWLSWTLQNNEEYTFMITSQAEDKDPINKLTNPIEEWSCLYKQLPSPSNSTKAVLIIEENRKFNSYEEILEELKKLNIISDINKCY